MDGQNDYGKQSRTRNSLINIITAVSGQGIGIIVSFVARIIFIRQLGEVYLGINSLYTNIVGLLSLAELGLALLLIIVYISLWQKMIFLQ